jgi:hypothetical protein
LGVQFGHAPVVEELATAHGVLEMGLPVVLFVGIAHRGGAAALGHHSVRLAEQRLAHHRNGKAVFPCFDYRAQSGATGTDNDDVVLVPFYFWHGREYSFS